MLSPGKGNRAQPGAIFSLITTFSCPRQSDGQNLPDPAEILRYGTRKCENLLAVERTGQNDGRMGVEDRAYCSQRRIVEVVLPEFDLADNSIRKTAERPDFLLCQFFPFAQIAKESADFSKILPVFLAQPALVAHIPFLQISRAIVFPTETPVKADYRQILLFRYNKPIFPSIGIFIC